MAAFAVWVLVVLVAASASGSYQAGVEKTETPGRRGQDNVISSVCPHGQVYMDKCNWAHCGKNGAVSSTFMFCNEWTCEKALAQVTDTNCYGLCNCERTTLITSCEKRGC